MNQLYPAARQSLGTAALNLSTGTLAVLLVYSTYTPLFATDANVSDVTSPKIAARQNLSSVSFSAGKLSAAGVNFGAISGTACNALVVYKNSGTDSTSPLIAYIDTAPGIPFLPTGGVVAVTWDAVNGIFTV